MSTLPTRTARRLVAPSWKDARLVVGVLLVLLSVVIGGAAFSAADDRVGMWAAARTLTPGHEIVEGDLVRVDVQLGDAAADYVPVDERLPNAAIVDRQLDPGELLPRSAVVDPMDARQREVPVRVDPIYLSNLSVGSRVTVYVPEPDSGEDTSSDEPTPYRVLVERATVSSLPTTSKTVIGSGTGGSAVIVVPADRVADLISIDQKDAPIKLVLESSRATQAKKTKQ